VAVECRYVNQIDLAFAAWEVGFKTEWKVFYDKAKKSLALADKIRTQIGFRIASCYDEETTRRRNLLAAQESLNLATSKEPNPQRELEIQ
jgi:hypothetical protein